MNPEKFMSLAQIIYFNPIQDENSEIKEIYYFAIKRYISMGKWKAKYVKAEMKLYQKILIPNGTSKQSFNLTAIRNNLPKLKKYKLNLIADLCAILGFEPTWCGSYKFLYVYKTLLKELKFNSDETKQAELLMNFILRNHLNTKQTPDVALLVPNFYKKNSKSIQKPCLINKFVLDSIEMNLDFQKKEPVFFIVTATMSAGKSTFINAMIGKNINLSQNLACTSKIHKIVNKAFEDGFSYEYDSDLELDADKSILFNDNEKNKSNFITVGTYFSGHYLQNKRCVICDSPGVNSYENEEHKIITQKMFLHSKFKTVIYILNATQLGTNDDEQHLKFIKNNLGKKSIIFILNKIDAFNEDDNINETIKKYIEYLKDIGFNSPIVCPVSSVAAVLAQKKMSGVELSRFEKRQLDNYIVNFEQNDLSSFYEKYCSITLNEVPQNDEEFLLKRCGISYVEKLISTYC